ncbi:hypothetical protein SLS62_002357 [Diatrype stigma]|uniref:Ig-like domain-containing protein n=1 Tax=Diatrype stigma TaxID=117547 RepID=A0AAN9V729_9PEZI
MRYGFLAAVRPGAAAAAAALWFSSGAAAARSCATDDSAFPWRVSDGRYDGDSDTATVAVSIIPGTASYGTFFECVASWPEAWGGWYEGAAGEYIIWSDCIWAGNGGTDDTTVSFATDWANKTMYISHTFTCSDVEGSAGLATGTLQLAMDCATSDEDGSTSCTLTSDTAARNFTTQGSPAPQEPGAGCADASETYQSWELEGWARQYELPPGSAPSDPPKSDTGPSFTLRSMASADVFDCAAASEGAGGEEEDDTFAGVCTAAGEGETASTAEFSFDRELNLLTVTQHWECEDS